MHAISFTAGEEVVPRSTQDTLYGVGFLVVSLAAAIVNLPSFLKLGEQSIYLKVMWRYGVLLILDSPLLLYDFLTSATPFDELVTANFTTVFFLSMLNCAYVFMVYNALLHTFAAHTLLLCSMATTFTTVWKMASKRQFSRLEYLGIGANVFGAYLCCCEGGPLRRIVSPRV